MMLVKNHTQNNWYSQFYLYTVEGTQYSTKHPILSQPSYFHRGFSSLGLNDDDDVVVLPKIGIRWTNSPTILNEWTTNDQWIASVYLLLNAFNNKKVKLLIYFLPIDSILLRLWMKSSGGIYSLNKRSSLLSSWTLFKDNASRYNWHYFHFIYYILLKCNL